MSKIDIRTQKRRGVVELIVNRKKAAHAVGTVSSTLPSAPSSTDWRGFGCPLLTRDPPPQRAESSVTVGGIAPAGTRSRQRDRCESRRINVDGIPPQTNVLLWIRSGT